MSQNSFSEQNNYNEESVSSNFSHCYGSCIGTTRSYDTMVKRNEENVMSAVIMYYNKNGAIIVSDSRETKDLYVSNDNCQKIFQNENIIFSIIGLYKTNDINFKEIISKGLLDGKSIYEIMKQQYNGKTLQSLIPNDNCINVFCASKNGNIEVYDIYSNSEIYNKVKKTESELWSNIPSKLAPLYNGLAKRYAISAPDDKPTDYKEMYVFSMQQLIRFEEELEKITKIKSDIGGKVQVATIDFNN